MMKANGSLATVASQGEVFLSSPISIKNVLHVPKLFVNLLTID